MAITTGNVRPPSHKKTFLLMVLIIGALTLAGILLMLRSRQTDSVPGDLQAQPLSYLAPRLVASDTSMGTQQLVKPYTG